MELFHSAHFLSRSWNIRIVGPKVLVIYTPNKMLSSGEKRKHENTAGADNSGT